MLGSGDALKYIGKIIPVSSTTPRGTVKAYITTMCLCSGCKNKTEYFNYTDYTGHLKIKHNLTLEQYPGYMPTANTAKLYLQRVRNEHLPLVAGATHLFNNSNITIGVWDS
jgi:hypothetical protein